MFQIFDKFNPADMKANARMLVGAQGTDPQFNSLSTQYEQALEKYGSEGSGKNLPFSSLSQDLKKKDKEKK